MIWTGKSPASAAASALLPLAVGPIRRIAAGLAATHEELVEVGEAHLEPRRPPVVALTGALGLFHFPQQGVHLRNRQGPVGAHRAVASHGSQQFVAALGQYAALTTLAEVAAYRSRQLV